MAASVTATVGIPLTTMSAGVLTLPARSVAVTKRCTPVPRVGDSGQVKAPVIGAAGVVQMIGFAGAPSRTSTTVSGSAVPTTSAPSEVPVGGNGGDGSIATIAREAFVAGRVNRFYVNR